MNRDTSESMLVIDDDTTFNGVLTRAFTRRGIPAQGALSTDEALVMARANPPSRAVLDLNIGGTSGLTLIKPLLEINPDCRIVVLTGYASISTAVDAIKLGAIQYLAKPVEVDDILAAFDGTGASSDETPAPSDPMSVDRLEWEHIQRVLRENDGNISATARALKMHRRTLQRKLSKRPAKE